MIYFVGDIILMTKVSIRILCNQYDKSVTNISTELIIDRLDTNILEKNKNKTSCHEHLQSWICNKSFVEDHNCLQSWFKRGPYIIYDICPQWNFKYLYSDRVGLKSHLKNFSHCNKAFKVPIITEIADIFGPQRNCYCIRI